MPKPLGTDAITVAYTTEQATALLAFTKVKLPGWLEAAEKTLRSYDMWPEDESE